jgi:nitrite reductase/ring-hydroxylating ferredoxin subunit
MAPDPAPADTTTATVLDTGYHALNPAYPRSWWPVAFTSDVPTGKVIPARLLERDVVFWRDQSGTLNCMAAHCPHLGAHLGKGGEVIGDELRCPFHGWGYRPDGHLASCPGPKRPRRNLVANPTYRVLERYGGVFLWNGGGEPDIELPDIMAELDLDADEYVACEHRWLMPHPAKLFAENVADGAHFAIAHDVSEWGATLALVYLTGPNAIGSSLIGWTPVEADSHCFFEMMLMPRLRIPLVGPLAQKALDHAMGMPPGPPSARTARSCPTGANRRTRRTAPATTRWSPTAASGTAGSTRRRRWTVRIPATTACAQASVHPVPPGHSPMPPEARPRYADRRPDTMPKLRATAALLATAGIAVRYMSIRRAGPDSLASHAKAEGLRYRTSRKYRPVA